MCGVCFIRCQKSCQKINSFLYFHFIYCYKDGVFFLHHQFLIISMANEPQQLHSTGMVKYIQQPNGNYSCIQCSFVTVDHNSPKCLITMFQYFIRLLPLFRLPWLKWLKYITLFQEAVCLLILLRKKNDTTQHCMRFRYNFELTLFHAES